MATFLYKAKKNTAETVTGQISARDQEEAIDLITQLGLLPVSVQSQSEEALALDLNNPRRVKSKDIYVFSRQMSNLIKSGVSILRALNIVGEQTQDKYFRQVVEHMTTSIRNGRSFSEALSDFPHIFSSLYRTMVHAGEESGNLQEILVTIAEHQRRQEELISKVKTALAYPILMGVMGLGTIYFVLTFVLPRLSSLFDSMDQLPLITTVLLKVSRAISHGWYVFLPAVLLVVIVIQRYGATEAGRKWFSSWILKMPIVGEVILKTELGRFSRTLVLLQKSGISLVKSLEVVIPILDNEEIKESLSACKDELIAGGSFGTTLRKSTIIPPMMGHLIAVGEESGNLTEIFLEIADNYEHETNESLKVFTTLLEPIMILTIGSIVGLMVFAMLLPIFQMDSIIR